MDRQDVLKRLLYPKCKTAIEFQFDTLIVNPLLSYITVQDIAQLNKIATSLKYSSKPKEKYVMIDNIMTNRGFKKMASGTNRVTYRCLNDYRIVIKIAIDKVGLSDNGNEYRNQHLLKPFVTKCFEISPCGTVGLFERVVPITSREEFINISDDIFDLINNLIGKYVLEDIGEKFYMNYGLREGFGPVLLDYPYVFELDGRKLICNVPEPMHPKGYCGGEIDYDLGYNDLVCKRCGKRYLATELKSDSKSGKQKIIIEGEDTIMRCVLKRGDEVVSKLNSEGPVTTNTIKSKKDFVKLTAQLSVREDEKEEEFKPNIKTSDEVQLRARLRGTPTSEDIDKKAREKEARLERSAEKIKVDFEPVFSEKPADPVSDFSAKLSADTSEKTEIVIDEVQEPVIMPIVNAPGFTVYIENDGEIYNFETKELVGYTCDKFINVVDHYRHMHSENEYVEPEVVVETSENTTEDLSDVTEEESDVVYNDPENVGTTIGDILESKSTFVGNENYKTTDIVTPIDGHFSNSTVSSSEEETTEDVEDINEEVQEIPELIIHPRTEDTEEVTYEDSDEYDPEYQADDSDNDMDDSENNNIDLY